MWLFFFFSFSVIRLTDRLSFTSKVQIKLLSPASLHHQLASLLLRAEGRTVDRPPVCQDKQRSYSYLRAFLASPIEEKLPFFKLCKWQRALWLSPAPPGRVRWPRVGNQTPSSVFWGFLPVGRTWTEGGQTRGRYSRPEPQRASFNANEQGI